MRLGIIGGTFNPIHYGHLRPAEEIRERLRLDRVFFIPSGQPPHKDTEIIEAHHRLEMVKTAIRANPFFDLSSIEVERKGKSYSVKTLEIFLEKYGNGLESFFILGIDAFLDVPTWREADRLFTLTNFVILSRPPYSFQSLSQSSYLKSLPISAFIELDQGIRQSHRKAFEDRKDILLEKVTALDISSTSIRKNLKAGKSIKYLLPDSVESYIIAHRLYRYGGARR